MPDIQIKIKNMAQIRAAFRAAPQIMSRNLSRAINLSLGRVEQRAVLNLQGKDRAWDTGTLASSIGKGYKPASPGRLSGSIGPTVKYAYYVHEGTGIYVGRSPYYANIPDVGWRYMKGMKPRPFLKHAVEDAQREVDTYFTQSVERTLSEIGRRT